LGELVSLSWLFEMMERMNTVVRHVGGKEYVLREFVLS
jgi:hypothetical protein